jgi:GTP pyrophosphokinase
MRHSYDPDLERLKTRDAAADYLCTGLADAQAALIRAAVPRVWDHRHSTPDFPDPFEVAAHLKELGADSYCIAATLLGSHSACHAIPTEQLRQETEQPLLRLIESVRWLNSLSQENSVVASGSSDVEAQAEKLRQLVLVMVEDVRALLIKLAFRVRRLTLLLHGDAVVAQRIARETLEIYAPLANRLGVAQLKWQLEDLSFRLLDPGTYKRIASALEERREDREIYIGNFVELLTRRLADSGMQDFEVVGRPKHLYSIWRKVQRKRVEVSDLYDVRAVRVLVDTKQQCYAALGIVHSEWQHLPREFDDYIANPKENGYQSLHTAVIGPEGKALEVQIRSRDMERDAELGIAAHWRYKEGGKGDTRLQKSINSLRALLDSDGNDEHLLEAFDTEVFSDRVYVFTPNGEVIDLPIEATPLDFAYHVHTEVGHRCRGAKVNGSIVPLGHKLRNGDRVEILTGKHSNPSRDWMNKSLGFLHTGRARGKVRAWFNVRDQETHLEDGRTILEREIRRLHARELAHEKVAEKLSCARVSDLYLALGRNEISGARLVGAINGLQDPEFQIGTPAPRRRRRRAGVDDIQVRGVGNLLTQKANCCSPVPYDGIVGYITRGKGVTVHRKDCSNVLNLRGADLHRLIDVDWGDDTSGEYSVTLLVVAYDRHGLLRDVMAVLANEGINITASNTRTDDADLTANVEVTVSIEGIDQLVGAMDKLRQQRNVISVERISGASA